jgi:hypothetical protein
MNFLSGLRERRELRRARAASELARLEVQRAKDEELRMVISEARNIFNVDDTGVLFDLYNYTTGDAIDEGSFLTMQRNAYQAWATDAYAGGWIEAMVRMVVGRNCWLKARDEDTETQKVLDAFCAGYEKPGGNGQRESSWPVFAQEFARRAFRDGESIVRKFVNPMNGHIYKRFLNPMWIKSGAGYDHRASFGIITSDNDIETPLTYLYWPWNGNSYTTQPIRIDASEVWHCKLNDSDAKRGRPVILRVIGDLVGLNKIMKSREKLIWLRSQFAVEKIYDGSSPDLIRASHESARTGNSTDSTLKESAPNPGSIARHSANVKYEFKTPNLQAMDVDVDIKRRLERMSVGMGLSYYVASGDISANTYDSGELAESPMLATIYSYREIFGQVFSQIGAAVLQEAIDKGELSRNSFRTELDGAKTTVPRTTEVIVDYPNIAPRDLEKETRSYILQAAQRWISDRTAQIKLGLNPEEEKARIVMETERKREQDEQDDWMNDAELMAVAGNGTGLERQAERGTGGNGQNGQNGKKAGSMRMNRPARSRAKTS